MKWRKILVTVVFIVGISLIGLFGTWPVFLGLLMFRWATEGRASELTENEHMDLHIIDLGTEDDG